MRIPLSPFPAVFLGFFLCLNPVQGQQVIDTATPVELGSLGVGAADHATLATNHYGDLVVANQTIHANGAKLVEATVVTPLVNGRFSVSAPILIGDPSLELTGEDSCRKPDVTALADGSFVIAFPRSNRLDHHQGQLELVLLRTRNASGDALAQAVVESPGAGRGYVLDANVNPGDGGVMPDLVGIGGNMPSACVVVYTTERLVTDRQDTVLREYNILLGGIDFAQPPGDADFLIPSEVIATRVPWDSNATFPKVGGLILPDITTDDHGNFVIAWEQFLLAPHLGLASGSEGHIVLERRSSLFSANPLQQLDRIKLEGADLTQQQRRPNLSTSRYDNINRACLSWSDLATVGNLDRVQYKVMEFTNDQAPGLTPPVDGFWIDAFNLPDVHAVPLLGDRFGFNFATRDYGTERRLISSYSRINGLQSMQVIDMGITFPWRPAADNLIVPSHVPGRTPDTYLAVICEGGNRYTSDRYRTYLRIDEH